MLTLIQSYLAITRYCQLIYTSLVALPALKHCLRVLKNSEKRLNKARLQKRPKSKTMTSELTKDNIVDVLQNDMPLASYCFENNTVIVDSSQLVPLCELIKTAPTIELDFLSYISAVDYPQFFELVYRFYSIKYNHALTVKVRLQDKQNPSMSSITPLYNGANYQEREIYDLFGITFTSHPNLKRIFLWETFPGHPLRKDFKNDNER